VTGEGITVTLVTEPLLSMYGKEIRPGATSVYVLPWDEVSGVSRRSSLRPTANVGST